VLGLATVRPNLRLWAGRDMPITGDHRGGCRTAPQAKPGGQEDHGRLTCLAKKGLAAGIVLVVPGDVRRWARQGEATMTRRAT
jgi:hypothetical protein